MAKATCSIDRCDRPVVARGWCSACYQRWQRHGDPLGGGASLDRGGPMRWLVAQVTAQALIAESGCVTTWPYALTGAGYPHLHHNGRTTTASGVMLGLAGVLRPSSRHEVLHSCDTPLCLTLPHLRWGTHGDNMKDAASKGRTAIGERNPNAVLTAEQVLAIRNSTETGMALASRYKIGRAQISRIRTGKRWRHIT